MNPSKKQIPMNCARSKKQLSIRINKLSVVLAVAITGWGAGALAAPIHEAAELGNLGKVKACLVQDPKAIDTVDARGRTVLARAALSGKKELVEFLLEKGATEDISAAAIVGHSGKVAAFVQQDKKRLNAKDNGGKAALHWAALYGQKKVVELLLAEKADVNLLDESGFTPLHWAAMFNKSDVVEVLLANRADINLKVQPFGWTPLRLAVIHGNLAAAEALLNGGSDPNVKEEENGPLLHVAAIRGNKEMVELLLAKKANVNLKDSGGETALDEALEHGHKEVAQILRQHGGKAK